MKKEQFYIVERPIRGTQSFLVSATSAKEARGKVDDVDSDPDDVQPLDFDIKFHGMANSAKLDV